MADSKVSFDSGDVSSIVASLNSSAQSLTSIASSVTSAFTPLTSCDLFTDGLSKLSQKIESIKSSFESIVTAIGGQTQTYSDVENAVAQAGDDYMSYYGGGSSGGGGGGGGSSSDEGLLETAAVQYGLAVNTVVDEEIKKIDDETLVNLINFININKAENVTISDILKEENSEILAKYLEAFYKQYTNKACSVSDATLVRKELIKSILNAKVDLPKSLKDSSIIKFKTYLEAIAKKCNTDVASLITDPQYSETMKTYLSCLYLNKVKTDLFGISESDLESFRERVAKITKQKNITADELFSNPIYLV